jgi:uncharacterized protein YdeI (YjbR/CyaY-like superfamily)
MEAIAVERSGFKVDLKEPEDFHLPLEFADALASSQKPTAAFEALTPGRRSGYLLHFSGAKQSKTRADSIINCSERLLAGKGLSD